MSLSRKAISRLLKAGVVLALVAAVTLPMLFGGGARTAVGSGFSTDHFRCYQVQAQTFKARQVTLVDQFQTDKATAIRAVTLCNPTSKQFPGQTFVLQPQNPDAHLLCYTIKSKPNIGQRTVVIANQLEQTTVTVLRSESLCLPTLKNQEIDHNNPEDVLDHFKCYAIRSRSNLNQTVFLDDQFGSWTTTIIKPYLLCNPVAKTFVTAAGVVHQTQILHPSDHLVCYRTEDKNPFTPLTVTTHNQFETNSLIVKKPISLCVPSLKTELP